MDHPDLPLGDPGGGEGRLIRRWRGGGLGRLVQVETADIDHDGETEMIVLAGRDLKIFDWSGGTYQLRWETNLPKDGLALAAGSLTGQGPPAVAIGTRDSVLLYTVTPDLGLQPLCQTLMYPNAFFRSLDLASIGGEGRAEVVAAASGAQTMYVFQVLTTGGEARLEETGRVYIGGLTSVQGVRDGEVATGSKDGYVDVFVPCSLLPGPSQAIYTVKRGDSLWRIARRFGISPTAVARANRLQEPYQLEPGQVLIIPPLR